MFPFSRIDYLDEAQTREVCAGTRNPADCRPERVLRPVRGGAIGGMGLVRAAYSAGKPAYGVGPGNAPCYIEQSADLAKAAEDIITGKAFDNGVLCSSPNSVVVDQAIEADVRREFQLRGGYFLSAAEADALGKALVTPQRLPNPALVGNEMRIVVSEVAGRLAVQEGAFYLAKAHGGRGILLAGVPHALRVRITAPERMGYPRAFELICLGEPFECCRQLWSVAEVDRHTVGAVLPRSPEDASRRGRQPDDHLEERSEHGERQAGDADHDGTIDGDDFFAIDAGYLTQASGFSNGDFDYSGRIDADDYFLIDSNYGKAQTLLGPMSVAAAGEVLAPAAVFLPLRRESLDLLQ